ncbi:MAG: hypothetical protein QM767_26805 [Anaeromyxobacter sp.]
METTTSLRPRAWTARANSSPVIRGIIEIEQRQAGLEAALEVLQGLEAVLGGHHRHAQLEQQVLHDGPDARVVIDDQDGS